MTPYLLIGCLSAGLAAQPDLRRALEAHWTFDGDLDAGFVNAPLRVDGVLGHSLLFNGVDQAVRIPHSPGLKPRDRITISAWVLPRALSGTHHVYRKEDGKERHLLAFQEGGTILALGLHVGGTYRELDASIRPGDFTDARWHLVTATYDGSRARMYRDGREIDTMPFSGRIGTGGTAPAFIGADKGREAFFDGSIDDVRIYSRALADGEVRALYEIGAAEVESASRRTLRAIEHARSEAEASHARRMESALQEWRQMTEREVLEPLDPIERASRCANGFLRQSPRRLPGPEGYYRPAFSCALLPTPVIAHGQGMMGRWECADLTSRAVLGWLAVREITGDFEAGRNVEEGEVRYLLSLLHPETGLAFVPDLSDGERDAHRYHSWDQSRALRALVRLLETRPDDRDRIRPLIDRMIRGLDEFSDLRGVDATWGPYACWSADEFDQDHRPVPHPFDRGAYPNVGELIPDPAGSMIEGLVMYAELTGDPAAEDLAIRFTNGELGQHRGDKFAADQKRFSGFAPDGAFAGHTHSKTTTLIGIVKLARHLARRGGLQKAGRYLRQVRKSYDWVLAADNPSRGSRIGWFRERPRVSSSEMCCTADMIELSSAMAGCAPIAPAFRDWAALWDDAESMTVNGIARTQIRSTPPFEGLLL